jgi:aminoglycoside phosphotransferase (APT) family kinase protein
MAKSPRKKNAILSFAHQLASHHFPRNKIVVQELGGGITNHVFEFRAGKKEFVIRISEEIHKINFFYKEQWAVQKAREMKIPVPEILEVGNDIIPYPYMIMDKLQGTEATHHPARLNILEEAGRLASLLHQIPTEGYGHVFDWSQNALSKKTSWPVYLEKEFRVFERMDVLKKNQMLPSGAAARIMKGITRMMKWQAQPCLQHGDIRLKNIVVNDLGMIQAIIDWEESISSIGPYWDLSIALHDLSVDAQQRFLQGYGMPAEELHQSVFAMKIFNVLNYSPVIAQLVTNKKQNKSIIEHYRMRLHGVLDLFSI